MIKATYMQIHILSVDCMIRLVDLAGLLTDMVVCICVYVYVCVCVPKA